MIGPFVLLLLALPVLLFGEWLMPRIGWLRRSNIPAPIVSGLFVAVGLLLAAEWSPGSITLEGSTDNPYWLWFVLPQWGFAAPQPTDVERPLLILFFTCIGLNASWRLAKQGGVPLLIYLSIAIGVGVIQAAGGVATALALGQSPLLGMMASNVALMGGFGTAAGFAPEFESAGLTGAATLGVAAAAFGVVAGGLVAGLIGGRLVETKVHRSALTRAESSDAAASAPRGPRGFIEEVVELSRNASVTLPHLAALLVCMKLGAFVSTFIQGTGITFPVYMGSMIVAASLRNAHDLAGGAWLKTDLADGIGAVALTWLLAVVIMGLQLSQLAHAALPMLVILVVQVLLLAALAYWLVFRVMGSDYEAAVMSAGMIGFGLGAASNSLATMRVIVQRFGPAPRAFLIVPIVGAFLIDFANALLTTAGLNLFR